MTSNTKAKTKGPHQPPTNGWWVGNKVVRPIFGYRLSELGHFQDLGTFIRRIGFGWRRERRLEAIIIRNRLSPNRLLPRRHHREEAKLKESRLFSKVRNQA
jgi:hypothetical protein